MKNTTRLAMTAPALGLAGVLLAAGPAAAATGSAQADLQPIPVNDVDGSGSAMVEVDGTTLSFTLAAQGLLADAPHAAHIHFRDDARHECPTAEDNTNGDDFLTTVEGDPAYGDIVVSLTTEGDTSPDSGLAVDRFGVGDDIEYSRTDVEVSQEVADAVLASEAIVVVHGVDHNGNGEYDAGERGESELDPALPGEATDPALCGVLEASQMSAMPQGGVDTGGGSTTGVENLGLIGAGSLAAVGGAALLARRRLATQRG